jgi:hypothetical protein
LPNGIHHKNFHRGWHEFARKFLWLISFFIIYWQTYEGISASNRIKPTLLIFSDYTKPEIVRGSDLSKLPE